MTALWTVCILLFWLGLTHSWREIWGVFRDFRGSVEKRALLEAVSVFQEIEETLLAGLVPSNDRWQLLHSLREPWKSLAVESIAALRSHGSSLLPTLKRLKSMASEHRVALDEAYSRSAQAFAQAIVCSCLVPLLGGLLYLLLPGLGQHWGTWGIVCFAALVFSVIGSLWLLSLANQARWGGLDSHHRSWVLSSQCAGERFLAMVRSGTPPDLAWVSMCDLLHRDSPELLCAWGSSVWEDPPELFKKGRPENVVSSAGLAIRKSIQVSLMEGRPCTERVEIALQALRLDMKALVDRELSLLPTRALKPLFICVAPALLSLLACGFWIVAFDVMEGL